MANLNIFILIYFILIAFQSKEKYLFEASLDLPAYSVLKNGNFLKFCDSDHSNEREVNFHKRVFKRDNAKKQPKAPKST